MTKFVRVSAIASMVFYLHGARAYCDYEVNALIRECQEAINAAKKDINEGIDSTMEEQAQKVEQGRAGTVDAANVQQKTSYSAILRLNKAQATCAEMTKNYAKDFWKSDRTKNADSDVGTCISACDRAEAIAMKVNTYQMQLVNQNRVRCVNAVKALQSELDRAVTMLSQSGAQ